MFSLKSKNQKIKLFFSLYFLFTTQWAIAQLYYTTDTVFVTASRVTAQIEKLPISISLIPEKIILLKTYGDLTNLFTGEGGIDFRNYSFFKGIATLSIFGSSSPQVLTLIDGIPFYSPTTGIADLGLIPVYRLKRVEVGKGAFSSLYGANALGGVVNFIRKGPFDLEPGRLNLSGRFIGGGPFSKFNTYLFHFLSGINWGDRKGFLFSFHQDRSKGIRSNEDGQTLGGGVSLAYANYLKLNFDVEKKEIGLCGPKPPQETIPPYGDSTATSLYDREKDFHYRIDGEVIYPIGGNLEIKAKPFSLATTTHYQWVDQYSLDTAVYSDTYQIKSFGGSLSLTFTKEETPFLVAFGIDGKWDNFWTHSYFYDMASYSYKDTIYNPKGEKFAFFLEGNFLKSPSLSSSLRWDWDKNFKTFFSPSLGISQVFPFGKFRFHIGRAFRAPTLNDLHWPKSGNLSLKPEVGWTAQAGFDIKILSLTFFCRRTKDLIAWFPDTAGLWRPTNVDQQEVFGLEWKSEIPIFNGVFFSFSGDWKNATQIRKEMVAYSDSFAVISRRAAFLPRFRLSPVLSFRRAQTFLLLEGNFTGDKVNYYPAYDSFPKVYMQEKRLPGYFLLALRLEQEILKRFLFTFKVENIFDVTYAEVFGNDISDRDYPRPGRIFFLGVEAKH
ncbi:MAG: TonB-dependent receptor [candidate division WOR-3 bacterium]